MGKIKSFLLKIPILKKIVELIDLCYSVLFMPAQRRPRPYSLMFVDWCIDVIVNGVLIWSVVRLVFGYEAVWYSFPAYGVFSYLVLDLFENTAMKAIKEFNKGGK